MYNSYESFLWYIISSSKIYLVVSNYLMNKRWLLSILGSMLMDFMIIVIVYVEYKSVLRLSNLYGRIFFIFDC